MEPFEKAVSYMQGVMEEGVFCGGALAVGVADTLYVKKTWGRTSFVVDTAGAASAAPARTPAANGDRFAMSGAAVDTAGAVNENTLYDMASVTKIMSTTMVALRMIAQGRLDLADMLPRFFGDANVPDDKKGITVFHLMTHTAGYEASIRLEDCCQSPAEIVPYLLSVPLAYQPGTQVIYSCMGFILLAKILERIGGKPLDELAREEVFEPLGLTHTGYHRLGLGVDYSKNTAYTERNYRRPDQIRGLVGPKEWLVGEVHDENAYFQDGVSGNAGVFSDLNDCIRYARMLAGHGTFDGMVYLPRCIFDAAIQNYTPGMDENRGLGFHLANGYYSMSGQFFSQKGFGHNGYTGPHIFVDPDTGLYVVLLLNRVHPTRENAAHLRVRRILHTLLAVGMEELQRAVID